MHRRGRRRRPGTPPGRRVRPALRPAYLSASRSGATTHCSVISIGQLSHSHGNRPTPAPAGRPVARQFMRRHWQKKPLLVRQAVPGMAPLLRAAELFDLAARDEVESRLVVHARDGLDPTPRARSRAVRCRRSPTAAGPCWCRASTCTIEGAHDLLATVPFRARRAARRPDDQLRQRWRRRRSAFRQLRRVPAAGAGAAALAIGRQSDLTPARDVPLKILANFEPEAEFRARARRHALPAAALCARRRGGQGDARPTRSAFARRPRRQLGARPAAAPRRGRTPNAPATSRATAIRRSRPRARDPGGDAAALQAFAREALLAALNDPRRIDRALGEYLTEPKANVWFDAGERAAPARAVRAGPPHPHDVRRAACLHQRRELTAPAGRDATLMRKLADQRSLGRARAGAAPARMRGRCWPSWCEAGWAHARRRR